MALGALGDGQERLKGSSFKNLVDKLRHLFAPSETTVDDFLAAFGSIDNSLSFSDFVVALNGELDNSTEEEDIGSVRNTIRKRPCQTNEEVIQYFSRSHGQWLETAILTRRTDGAVELQIKPGYWMEPQEQETLLRHGNGMPFKSARTSTINKTEPPAAAPVTAAKTAKPATEKLSSKASAACGHTNGNSKKLARQDLVGSLPNSDTVKPDPGMSNIANLECRRAYQIPSAKARIGPGGCLVFAGRVATDDTTMESHSSSCAPLPPEDDELPMTLPTVKNSIMMGGVGASFLVPVEDHRITTN